MLLAKITVTMTVDDSLSENELDVLCENVESFTYRLNTICEEFNDTNKLIITKLED